MVQLIWGVAKLVVAYLVCGVVVAALLVPGSAVFEWIDVARMILLWPLWAATALLFFLASNSF